VFYPLYGTYTKTFIIFGLAPDLLHNFKHQAILIKKEKEKHHCCAGGPLGHSPSRPGSDLLRALRPTTALRRRPTGSAHAGVARALPSSLVDTDERAPLVSSISLAPGGLAALPVAAGEVQAPHQGAHQLRFDLATP
jgi:hypothetical protein